MEQGRIPGMIIMRTPLTRLGSVLVLLISAGSPSRAGTITFGGNLANNLPGVGMPVATPATLAAGQTFEFPFRATLAGVGMVSGDIKMTNNATATGGSIVVTDFRFASLSPANGATPIQFDVTIDQDFASKIGTPQLSVTEHLDGSFTFTARPQDGSIGMATQVNRKKGLGFGLAKSTVNDGLGMLPISPPDQKYIAPNTPGTPVDAMLALVISLSNNTLNNGPAIALPSSASVSFAVPEPPAWFLGGFGVAGVLGYRWLGGRCRRR
jgi:hypothetical protein